MGSAVSINSCRVGKRGEKKHKCNIQTISQTRKTKLNIQLYNNQLLMEVLLLTTSNKTLFKIFFRNLANIGKPSQYAILKSVCSVNLVFWFQMD